MINIAKIKTFFFILLCVLTASPLAAQTYIWEPGGADGHLLERGQVGRDLTNKDFRGSHFDYASMSGFSGSNFENSNFEGSRFGEILVDNTSFRGANLRNVDASGMAGVVMDREDGILLPDCNFTDADITGATLPLTGEQLRSTKNYKNKNLAGVKIFRADLTGTSFAGFNLTGARLYDTLKDCDFTDADITKFGAENLTFAQLKTTKNYKNHDLSETMFQKCNFDNADFRGFRLGFFSGCSFRNADFRDALFVMPKESVDPQIRLWSFRAPGFSACELTRQQFESTKNYQTKDLSRLYLEQMDLKQWNFRDCNLDNARLGGSALDGADFTNTSILKTFFGMISSSRYQTILAWEQFRSTRSGQARDFTDVWLANTVLRGWDFSNTDLTNVSFSMCEFTDSIFDNATIKIKNFGVPLVRSQSGELIYASDRWGLTRAQFESTANYRSKVLRGADFGGSDLSGMDFSGFDLTNAEFAGRIAGARFDDAIITGCRFYKLTKEQFCSTATYKSGVVERVNFGETDFTDWNLSNARFVDCINAPPLQMTTRDF